MTALLTDEAIFGEAEEFTVNPISTDSFRQGFRLGAEYARSIYEARLAEDAKVRAGLVEAMEPFAKFLRAVEAKPLRGADPETIYAIHTGTEWEAELKWQHLRNARAALSAAKEIK